MSDQMTGNSIVDSASKLYQAASLTSPPVIFGKLKNWLLDCEANSTLGLSDEAESSGSIGTKILKKVG